ncbi:MAG: GUN4 domain-containing protein [Trichodesmium sp. MAG_R01]|nr:GUN4 domain-containing protein [Trichodesmium sp. MAG_R01]
MKSLLPIIGITFLSITLTNFSSSFKKTEVEEIATRLEDSIVKLSYKNQPGDGTGFFVEVDGKPEFCSVLTAAHIVQKEGQKILWTEKDEKVWDVATVERFPGSIDLALVTFKPHTKRCNYPALKIGKPENLKIGSSIFVYGFPRLDQHLVAQFVEGKVSALKKKARGYGVAYKALTAEGMSGSPVVDIKGEVVAVHGSSNSKVVPSLISQQTGLPQIQWQLDRQTFNRINNSSLTCAWGVPINYFRESKFYNTNLYSNLLPLDLNKWIFSIFSIGALMFSSGIVSFQLKRFQAPQVLAQEQNEREREFEDKEFRGAEEVGSMLGSPANIQTQLQNEQEREFEDKEFRGAEEVGSMLGSPANIQTQQQQRQGGVQVLEPLSSVVSVPLVSVPLVSAAGVDYTRLYELLAARRWKEADYETYQRMIEVVGRESQGWLRIEDTKNFPSQDLGIIDKLWLRYSNGMFGFSVQKQVYQSLGGTQGYDQKVVEDFGDKVGWRLEGEWLSYDGLTVSENYYRGHLPCCGNEGSLYGWAAVLWSLLSHKDL